MSRDATYSIGDREAQVAYVGGRTAREYVPFFLPHRRLGIALLDCGCGVGSHTLDLAERVAPGEVVGVDIDAGQLASARAEAARRGLTNMRFAEVSTYALPFPAGSFDAVLAHTLLIHLREPLAALRVLRRQFRPGGVACISDDGWGTHSSRPSTRWSSGSGRCGSACWNTRAAACATPATCAGYCSKPGSRGRRDTPSPSSNTGISPRRAASPGSRGSSSTTHR
jgi:SAM-dependent methyltransferase